MKSPNINFPFPGWWAAFRAAAKISPTTIAAAITSLPFLSLFPFLSSPWSGSRIPADHGKGKEMKGKGKGGRMCGSQCDVETNYLQHQSTGSRSFARTFLPSAGRDFTSDLTFLNHKSRKSSQPKAVGRWTMKADIGPALAVIVL